MVTATKEEQRKEEDHGKDGLMRLKRIMKIWEQKLVYSGQRQEGMKESVLIAKVHNRL
jgi:hypothetical protein